MYASRGCLKTVSFIFVSAVCCCTARSQTAQFMRVETAAFRVAALTPASRTCAGDLSRAPSVMRTAADRADVAALTCDLSPTVVSPVQPCNPSNLNATGCRPFTDSVRDNLDSQGKTGQKISQARERVLEILRSDNACTEWYRSKDPNPAATFRTLSFELDRKGTDYVLETPEPGVGEYYHSPYVARVIQGDGSYATVTLNANGAFFSIMAKVAQTAKEGGPLYFRGVRPLKVGPYAGNTLQAQVLTLLHEFGHLLELLPADEGDRDGKSVRNSMEVLRYCRAEVESKGGGHTLRSSR